MKIVLFSLLCVILIGITSYSYADILEGINPGKDTKLEHEVLVQLEIRDSNGSLLAYVESDQILMIRPGLLNRFLDAQNQTQKEFFIKDDKKYEIQQWEIRPDVFAERNAYSGTLLQDLYQNEFYFLVSLRHDSFQVQPGDTARFFWTVIRPVS